MDVTGYLTHELADLLLGIKQSFFHLLFFVGCLLSLSFLLSGLDLQFFSQPSQLCLQPGQLFLGIK